MKSLFSIANAVSVARLLISPIMVWCILERKFVLSAALFIFACLTDVLDGIVARSLTKSSRFGGILDHCADCAFVSSALFALALIDSVPILLPTLVVVAFVQYLLDSRVFQRQELIPSKLGRWNGISYFVLVGIVLGEYVLSLTWITEWYIRQTVAWVLITSTVFSMGERLVLLWKGKR